MSRRRRKEQVQDMMGITAPRPRATSALDEKARVYAIVVVQQPQHARSAGFGDKDRRPLDPLPIIKLTAYDDFQCPLEPAEINYMAFIVQVVLCDASTLQERELIHFQSQGMSLSSPYEDVTFQGTSGSPVPVQPRMRRNTTRILLGTVHSAWSLCRDERGEWGIFAAFPDLSVRVEGEFRLKFSLVRLGTEESPIVASGSVVATAHSDIFRVYHPRRFPGMLESTPLSRALARQGISIPIRNTSARERQSRETDTSGNSEY